LRRNKEEYNPLFTTDHTDENKTAGGYAED
jgi:hypothetical protein